MFEFSFLTILNIYKNYFKAVTVDASECNLMQMFLQAHFDQRQFALVQFFLQEAVAFLRRRVL